MSHAEPNSSQGLSSSGQSLEETKQKSRKEASGLCRDWPACCVISENKQHSSSPPPRPPHQRNSPLQVTHRFILNLSIYFYLVLLTPNGPPSWCSGVSSVFARVLLGDTQKNSQMFRAKVYIRRGASTTSKPLRTYKQNKRDDGALSSTLLALLI